MALGACFVCMAMAMDSEQVAQFPWAPVPASPWGSHTGKRRRRARGDCTLTVDRGPAWECKYTLY